MGTAGWSHSRVVSLEAEENDHLSASVKIPVTDLVKTYVFLLPLLFFAVHGSFSFEYGATNSTLSAFGGKMASIASPETSLRERLQALSAMVLSLIPVFLQNRLVASVSKRMMLTLSIPLFAIASSMWSQDAWLSLRSGVSLLVTTLFAFYLASALTEAQQMELFMLVGALIVISSILMALFWPQYGLDHQLHEGAWQGLFMQKNVCAEGTLFLLTPAFAITSRGRNGQFIRAVYIALCILLIVMTQSRTGWLMTALYIAFFLMLRLLGRLQRKDLLPLTGLLFAATGCTLVIVFEYPGLLLALVSRSGDLSGRTAIWKAVELSILRRPLLGYGFDAFWSLIQGEASRVFASAGWVVTSAHNGFLNVGLELGVVGLTLVCATIVQAIRNANGAFRPGRSGYVDWCIGLVFLTIIYNLDERTLLATQYLPWVLFLIACVGLQRSAERGQASAITTGGLL